MFEHRTQPLLPRRRFFRRLGGALLLGGGLIAFALGVGVLGYHFFACLPWIDALLNASMILTGMGPVDRLETHGAKVFASAYALFSGLVFISLMGLLLSPVAHRVLHRFHLSEEDLDKSDKGGSGAR